MRMVKRWSVELTDHLGTTRQIATGQRDKKTAEAIGRSIERLVRCRVSGEPLDPVTAKWLEGIGPKLRTALEKFGLLDAARMAALRPLTEHVNGTVDEPGWRQYLASKGSTPLHVDRYAKSVLRAFKGSGAVYWSDISATRLMAWLHEQRADEFNAKGRRTRRGFSAATVNRFVTALGGFARWMQREGRANTNPMASLQKLNAKTDKRHVRRPLDAHEVRWLLDTTRTGPERADMTGPERAMLYRLAVETGLRSSELASLTRASFRLDGNVPIVTVQAAYSKRRRDDVLPLRPDTAAVLRDFLAAKPATTSKQSGTPTNHAPTTNKPPGVSASNGPMAKAFNMPPWHSVAKKLLRPDLDAARQAWIASAETPQEREQREASSTLCYIDAQGHYADFHALRHTTGTLLAAGGVNPKTAQSLMRHSDINLTMSLYTHTLAGQESAAVAALPNFNTDPAQEKPKPTDTTTNDTTTPPANDATAPAENTASPPDNATASTDTAPAKADMQNSPENSLEACKCSESVCDESGRSNVLEENTKKDENIVKVDYFPVKSEQPRSGAEPPISAFAKSKSGPLKNPTVAMAHTRKS